MRIMEVIGTVSLSQCHPSLGGATWKLAVPLSHANLLGDNGTREEPIVVFDELGAGIGHRLAVSESAEAAAPFHPDTKPIDAYNAAILDQISVDTI